LIFDFTSGEREYFVLYTLYSVSWTYLCVHSMRCAAFYDITSVVIIIITIYPSLRDAERAHFPTSTEILRRFDCTFFDDVARQMLAVIYQRTHSL
jgi:hypothetical protein